MTLTDFLILGLLTWLVVLIGIEIAWRRVVRREIRADAELAAQQQQQRRRFASSPAGLQNLPKPAQDNVAPMSRYRK